MNLEQVQIIAGSLSSLMFASGTVSMLVKVWRTHDLRSYSRAQIILNNIGNLIYWLYVWSLPVGPVWILHGFFTASSLVMLIAFHVYCTRCQALENRQTARSSVIDTQGMINASR